MPLTRKGKVIEAFNGYKTELGSALNKDLWLRSVQQLSDKYLGLNTPLRQAWHSAIHTTDVDFETKAKEIIDRCIKHINIAGLYREGNFLRNVKSEVLLGIIIFLTTIIFGAGSLVTQIQNDKKFDKQDLRIDSLRLQVKLYMDSLRVFRIQQSRIIVPMYKLKGA